MRRIVWVLLLVACESSPVAPVVEEPLPPPVIHPANIVRDGGGVWAGCFVVLGCTFRGGARNIGLGCAALYQGTVRFYDSRGSQLGPPFDWKATGAPLILAPGASFAWVADDIPESIARVASSFEVQASWMNVRC